MGKHTEADSGVYVKFPMRTGPAQYTKPSQLRGGQCPAVERRLGDDDDDVFAAASATESSFIANPDSFFICVTDLYCDTLTSWHFTVKGQVKIKSCYVPAK